MTVGASLLTLPGVTLAHDRQQHPRHRPGFVQWQQHGSSLETVTMFEREEG